MRCFITLLRYAFVCLYTLCKGRQPRYRVERRGSMKRSVKRGAARPASAREELLRPREAALELRVSFPALKQWIYHGKIRSVRTPGGHHRIPQSEVDRYLYRTRGKTAPERDDISRRVSG